MTPSGLRTALLAAFLGSTGLLSLIVVLSGCSPTSARFQVVGPSGASWGHLDAEQKRLFDDILGRNLELRRMDAYGIIRWGIMRHPKGRELVTGSTLGPCLAQVTYTQVVPKPSGGYRPVVYYSDGYSHDVGMFEEEDCSAAAMDGLLAIGLELDRRDFHAWSGADDQHFSDFVRHRGLVPATRIREFLEEDRKTSGADTVQPVLARCNDVIVAGSMDAGDRATWQAWAEAACAGDLKGTVVLGDESGQNWINSCGLTKVWAPSGHNRLEKGCRIGLSRTTDDQLGHINARYMELMHECGGEVFSVDHKVNWR